MICPKCKKPSLPDASFCPYCGRNLSPGKKRRAKSRGNGTGCAYWDSVHRYWVAQVIDGYRYPEDKQKQLIPVKNKEPVSTMRGSNLSASGPSSTAPRDIPRYITEIA